MDRTWAALLLAKPSERGCIDAGGLRHGQRGARREASLEQDERTEKGEGRLRGLLRLAGVIALVALGLMVIVVAICWLAGWRTASQIGSGFTLAGIGAIAAGVLSTLGGWGVMRDPQYMYAQSVSHQDTASRTRQALGDSLRSYNLAILATGAGILCIVVGALLRTFLT
jgi:hypothetical protein